MNDARADSELNNARRVLRLDVCPPCGWQRPGLYDTTRQRRASRHLLRATSSQTRPAKLYATVTGIAKLIGRAPAGP